MDTAKNISILRSIVQVTQVVQNATARRRYSNTRGIRQLRRHSLVRLESDFQTIVNATLAILKVLDDPLLRSHYMFDDRLKDWLLSTEPKTCLDALKEMAKPFTIGRGARAFANVIPARSTCEEDDVNAAIVLFQAHRGHFHFFLTTDVWNHENPVPLQMLPPARTEEAQEQAHEQPQSVPEKDTVIETQKEETACTVSSEAISIT